MGAEYAFWVRGRVGPEVLAALEPLRPVTVGRRTELRAVVADQVALHAVIARLDALALRLIAFHRVPEGRPPVPAGR